MHEYLCFGKRLMLNQYYFGIEDITFTVISNTSMGSIYYGALKIDIWSASVTVQKELIRCWLLYQRQMSTITDRRNKTPNRFKKEVFEICFDIDPMFHLAKGCF